LEKRTLIAILLIFLIYWASSQFLWKQNPQQQQTPRSEVINQTEHSEPSIYEDSLRITRDFLDTRTSEQVANTTSSVPQIPQNDNITIENDLMKLTFTNKGGLLTQVLLKDFFLADRETPVTLIPENSAGILQVDFPNRNIPFISEEMFIEHIEKDSTSQTLTFSYHDPRINMQLKRIYTLYDDYRVDFVIEGENLPHFSSYTISLKSGINITEHNKAALKAVGRSFAFVSAVGREVRRTYLDKIPGSHEPREKFRKRNLDRDGAVNWAAVRSKYFVMCLIPEIQSKSQSVVASRVSDTFGFDIGVSYDSRKTGLTDKYSLYLGPVDYDRLIIYKNGMENIAELGMKWLRPLAKVFLWVITNLYKPIPNYGVVILVFALWLKLLLTPLTNKSLTASRRMQKIQPIIRQVQTKYKNDIKQQQEELKKIYKEHNVSPLGGCLPLLLQMPIFFALYPVLHSSIEFRQAFFVGWLSDLSVPDPYWILPILMGIFMFIQQKMMAPQQDTSQMDDKQAAMVQSQKMMQYLMPPFLVFIFSGLPSGLVLYWTSFNVFNIAQQYFFKPKD
jgi:YidC/Oxa1 family membrane protein insertase